MKLVRQKHLGYRDYKPNEKLLTQLLVCFDELEVEIKQVNKKADVQCFTEFVGEIYRLCHLYEIDLSLISFNMIRMDDKDNYVAATITEWEDGDEYPCHHEFEMNERYFCSQAGIDEVYKSANEGIVHPPTERPFNQYARHEFAHLLQTRTRPYKIHIELSELRVGTMFALKHRFIYNYALTNILEFEAERFAYLQEQEPNRRLEPNEWMILSEE